MPGYRVEICPNNRAMCKNPECKNSGVKITKGELRFASMVKFQDKESWAYKHWGCVTPAQIDNLREFINEDLECVDGLDELPEDDQEKVKRAIQQGHVDDEDWKGDAEKNRPGQKGMRLTAKEESKMGVDSDEADEKPAKKAATKKAASAAKADDADEDAAPAKKPATKKRGRAAKIEDADEEEPAAKKAKGKKGAKASKAQEADEDDEPAEEAPTEVKKARATKKKAPIVEADDEDPAATDDDEPVPAPKTKRVRAKKVAQDAVDRDNDPKPAPKAKRTKVKPAPVPANDEEDGAEDDALEAAPKAKKAAPQKRGRKAKA